MQTDTLPFHVLTEEEYLPAMENECAAWRAQCVTQGSFKSFDGVPLVFYKAVPENAKACVVLLHGFCEFFGRYHEMAWNIFRMGYAVFFLEQRGHGHSGGHLAEPDIVHIDDFSSYVKDLDCFMKNVVDVEAQGLKKLIVAHSMGGCVGGLYLETHPDVFAGAVFSSPMFRLKKVNFPPPLLSLIRLFIRLTHREKTLAIGESHFEKEQVFETSSMRSKAHFTYQNRMRLEDINCRTCAASFGWGLSAIDATHRVVRDAGKVRVKVVLMTAGIDALVDPSGYADFMKKAPHTERIVFPDSKHELFNADDADRERFYTGLYRALGQF